MRLAPSTFSPVLLRLRSLDLLNVLARRASLPYMLLLCGLALMGHLFILISPAAVLLLPFVFWAQLNTIATEQDLYLTLLTLSLLFYAIALTVVQARMRPTQPKGPHLSSKRYPTLYQDIKLITRRCSVSMPQRVQVALDSGVEVVRIPRNGYPYRLRTHLVLGLFSLQALESRHIRALMARHFQRFSSRGFRLTNFIIDHLSIWESYSRSYASRPSLNTSLLLLFFIWYTPLFRLLARPVVQRSELKLDALALELIGDADFAEALTINAIIDRYLEQHYWPQLEKLAEHRETPPTDMLNEMEETFARLLHSTDAVRIAQHLVRPDNDEGNPSLSERLGVIGHHQPPLLHAAEEPASRRYLGPQRHTITQALARRWYRINELTWKRRYRKRKRLLALMQHYEYLDQNRGLNREELQRYSELVERLLGSTRAAPLFRRLLQMAPEDAQLHFDLGSRLIDRYPEQGRKLLRRALEIDKERFEEPVQQLLNQLKQSRQ